jgi:hypothetical protein
MTTADQAPTASPSAQLARLLDGYLTTQLLYVAATLGLADALADGPQPAATVATMVGADPDVLARLLRGLALAGVVAEDGSERYALTPLGACLRAGVPGSQRGAALARGEIYYGAAAGLLQTVRAGGVAFEHIHGARFFDYLARDPGRETAFQASMADRARQEADAVVAAYDFSPFRQVLDVGGGGGILLEAIVRATPTVAGVLLDRATVVEAARTRLEAGDLGARIAGVAGDFFSAIPAGADAYLLSRVLHDWDDDAAIRILANCRRAIPAAGRLLVLEAVLAERAHESPGAVRMDLHMLTLLGGRERTAAQYRALLAGAGLELRRILPTGSPSGICVIEATRATGEPPAPGPVPRQRDDAVSA